MGEEGHGQGRVARDARQTPASGSGRRAEIGGTQVGKFPSLDVAPQRFHRVEVGRVAGQGFDVQPATFACQVRLHQPALVRGEPVPDQEAGAGAQLALQRLEKPDQALRVVAIRFELKEQPTAPAVPAVSERGGGGHSFPVEGMDENGRFTLRGPSPTNDRALGEAAFVYEDEPATLAPGFFLSPGHRSSTHCRTAAGLRSFACRAGRCSDQPSCGISRHTWPG